MMVQRPTLFWVLLTLFTGMEWDIGVDAATREYILSKADYDAGVPFSQPFGIVDNFDGKRMERVPIMVRDSTSEFPLHVNKSKSFFQFPTDGRQNMTASFQWTTELPYQEDTNSAIDTAERNSSDERSVQIVQNWWSFYPFHWMPKLKEWDTTSIKSTTSKSVSKEGSVEEETATQGPNMSAHISDKIKRLLNLFAIVKFDNIQCYENGTTGVCLHRFECESRHGKFSTTCAHQQGVCCHVETEASNEKTCGGYSKDFSIDFVSGGIPIPSVTAPKVCTLTLDKTNPDVSQLRLEFMEFQLREPTNGTCFHDRLVITGQNIENAVPELCGFNSGQHIYVDVEDSVGPYTVNVVLGGEYYPRNFKIRITQLKKGDEKLAPKHCLQFYTDITGLIESFNYRKNKYGKADETNTGYFNNLNYAICIRKVPGYCSISYENVETGNVMQPTFQMINTNEVGDVLLQPRQAGAETFDCPNDYIIIAGMRLCGEKLNDGSINGDLTKNYPITDTSNGPFFIVVRTDQSQTGRGFSLTYQQNSC